MPAAVAAAAQTLLFSDRARSFCRKPAPEVTEIA
jgi:hypothetical protein